MKVNGSESVQIIDDAAPSPHGAIAMDTAPAAPAPGGPSGRRWIDAKTAAAYCGVGVKIIRAAVAARELRGSAVGSRGQLRFWQDIHHGGGGWCDDWLRSLSEPVDDAPSYRMQSRRVPR